MKKSVAIGMIIAFLIFTGIIQSFADDTDLFVAEVPPDALIVLDLSGSMRWTPAGERMYINSSQTCQTDVAYYDTSFPGQHDKACTIDPYGTVPKYSNSTCTGPFYINNSHSGYTTDCSRLAIAKRSIFSLLDDNDDSTINTDDEANLGIRLGYMRFYDCGSDDTGGNYSSGCNRLRKEINDIGSGNYSQIWSLVNGESATDGTPLASALNEARLYLDYQKSIDPLKECRKKFVILVTDGADTFACSGNGSEGQTDQYKRRRETIAKAKALAEAGYNVFVIGFGATMPHYLRNTLNWAAFYGKTDNPQDSNSGNTNGYNIPSDPPGSLYPSGITSCQSSSYDSHNLGDGTHYYATSNEPGEASLSGYAFLATDASQLTAALKAIAKYIQERGYSFTSPTVPSVQLVTGDKMYISSFIPKTGDPFWEGSLKAYRLNTDGTLPVDGEGHPLDSSRIWNASIPGSRTIKTYRRSEFVEFNNSNLTKEDLAVETDAERDALISYVRNLALGDIFHSNAVIIGEPSRNFEDIAYNGPGGFYETNKNRTKVIIAGANDGMLHAFNAGNYNPGTGTFDDGTGVEQWAFIPNSLLKNLKTMLSTHTYYVDSSPKVADVWFDYNADNTKTVNEWRTVLVSGLRKGGKHYFALDITNTLSPQYLWEFPHPGDPMINDYNDFLNNKIGESWSEPAIGRVKIESGSNLVEKWVAFIGGGFDPNEKRDTDATVGKAFFVIDMRTGEIIKEFSGLSGITHAFAAPPTAVDTNLDGFIDKVYIGDLGGQMWVFDVSFNEATKKSNSQWTGKRLFVAPVSSSEKHNIYYQPAVAFDNYGNPWVYFGTGDRENPKDATNPRERFYAVKDDGQGTYPRTESNLSDVTSLNTFDQVQDPLKGWYIKLEKSGQSLEKVLAKPVVFYHLLYFTTYTYTESANPCYAGGVSKLYVVEFLSGGGALMVDDFSDLTGPASERSSDIGAGVPSAPVISVNLKGKATVIIGTTSGQIFSAQVFSPQASKQPLYWREVIH